LPPSISTCITSRCDFLNSYVAVATDHEEAAQRKKEKIRRRQILPMTYDDAIQFLYNLRLFGTKLGLANTFRLAELSGKPHEQLRFIHVAGTNGKGSTCAMLESIYRTAGLRVGLFTSPHLVSFAERMQVNRRLIPEADVVRLLQGLQPLLQQFPEEGHPTFFELVTVMALRYFAEHRCDLVILETGMGGRLDATNIVTPLTSVITNVQHDHQKWLGETLTAIATEKAGIIKPGVPALTAAEEPDALRVIEEKARQENAPLTRVTAADANRPPLDAIHLPLHGAHQRLNAALAVATVRALTGTIAVTEDAIRRGLSTVYWPGRLQSVRTSSGQTIVLDGAHNPAGAEALRLAFQTEFPTAKPTLIFGVFQDKDSASMVHSLSPIAARIVLVPVHSARSEDPARLVPACREMNPNAPIAVCGSLAEALEQTARDPLVVVAGSLYLVGEAMELLHLATVPANDEKKLNEWGRFKSAADRSTGIPSV
jgi:dihydrofolate synthase / folylpolyglutamate synthase